MFLSALCDTVSQQLAQGLLPSLCCSLTFLSASQCTCKAAGKVPDFLDALSLHSKGVRPDPDPGFGTQRTQQNLLPQNTDLSIRDKERAQGTSWAVLYRSWPWIRHPRCGYTRHFETLPDNRTYNITVQFLKSRARRDFKKLIPNRIISTYVLSNRSPPNLFPLNTPNHNQSHWVILLVLHYLWSQKPVFLTSLLPYWLFPE